MSRIGKMPIAVPAGVTVEVAENNKVTVKGPKGTLTRVFPAEISFEQEDGHITVKRPDDQKKSRALHGLSRSLLNNMVVGVTDGFEKKLEVNGVGYRAAKNGKTLTLTLGYSHPVELVDPEGVETVDQLEVLRRNNCLVAQGYFFDRPLPLEEFESRLEQKCYNLSI